MIRTALPLIALSLLTLAPARADEAVPYDLAVSRLRACAISGATNARYDNLTAAVVAVRSLCLPQLNRVYAASDSRVADGNPAADDAQLDDLRKQARRKIDFELAQLVANATGLQP